MHAFVSHGKYLLFYLTIMFLNKQDHCTTKYIKIQFGFKCHIVHLFSTQRTPDSNILIIRYQLRQSHTKNIDTISFSMQNPKQNYSKVQNDNAMYLINS